MRISRLVIGLFLAITSLTVSAQDYTNLYQTASPFNGNDAGKLSFRIENANFIRNHEYDSPVIKGYTLTGLWVRPMVEYYASEKLRVQLGGHFLKYHGQDKINKISPWFSLTFRPTDYFEATVGNFNNDNNFGMIAPLHEPDHFLTEKPKASVQFKYFKGRWDAEVWLNWSKFIEENDPFQERFAVGLRADYQFYNQNDWDLRGTFQFVTTHRGGEIDTSDDRIESIGNKGAGIKWTKKCGGSLWGGTAMYLDYKDFTNRGERAFEDGKALYVDGYWKNNGWQIGAGFWSANKLIAPLGRKIYQSVNELDGSKYPDRQLVSGRLCKTFEIMDGARFGLETDAYFDLKESTFSYTWGIQLIFTESFFIKKLK
ncbi:hypothetical protein EMN47_08090 [Prolixibacteraceae bacterium JC049]|nr:hypothetical protein [Prolixibacteraceae bacterium JC049]